MRPADEPPAEAGTEAARALPPKRCPACRGAGAVTTRDGATECPACEGEGEVPPNECEDDEP